MAMLNAPTTECDRINLRRSGPVQKRQQIFGLSPRAHLSSSMNKGRHSPKHSHPKLRMGPSSIPNSSRDRWCLRWRKTVVALTVLMFVGSVAGFALVQQQFFPTSTRSELFFEMRLPEGTAIGVTDASAKRAERLLAGDPDIVTYTTYVGQGSPRFWLGLNPVLPNPNFAQIVIVTKDLAARERVKARLERAIADGALPEARARVDRFLLAVFPVMAIAMLAILMIQLQSFSRLALVFATAPLGLIGATGALLISNRPFGFVALLGLIALAGMIMRNTVILVDQIDRDIAAGHGRHRAIIDATVRRARPVILTALAAILGMIPLAGSIFWGPMAITIMGGLLVATALTLLVVPALYALWFRVSGDETHCGAIRSAQQRKHPCLLRIRSRLVMAGDPAAGRLRTHLE
jgi:multidrug efflux pump subunit AcrB